MPQDTWIQEPLKIQSLHFDERNPRLGQERRQGSPREIITYLFETENAIDVAKSIATRGYFPNEPLLVVVEEDRYVVVEGNRRLAALKSLVDPDLVEGSQHGKVVRVSEKWKATRPLAFVPCVIAPSRREANRVVAGRHQSNAVMSWSAEDRAQFILDCIDEGYTIEQLESELGFTGKDVQEARQRRAIVEMIRALKLSDEVRARVDSPRAQILSTIERVFNSRVGREYLMVERDPDIGLRGTTSAAQFKKGLRKLVTDVATPDSEWDSRSLNTIEDIGKYFEGWGPGELPRKVDATFTPAEIVGGAPQPTPTPTPAPEEKRRQPPKKPVIPVKFMVEYCGSDRIREIHEELTKLKPADCPNSGAVLLRVFTELVITDYLKRADAYDGLVDSLKSKQKLQSHGPTFQQQVTEVLKLTKNRLDGNEHNLVRKAFSNDKAAPFTLSELHSFVHSPNDLPSARDIEQFWSRAEPLFRIMLQESAVQDGKHSENS